MYGEYLEDPEATNNEIRARAAAYQAENLSVEKKRLDFLEMTGTRYVYSISGSWFFRASEETTPKRMPSLRAAIDAARKQEGAW